MKDYTYFKASELACKCGECDGGEMDEAFMEKLISIRAMLGEAVTLTSAYRCKAYDKSIGGKGAHSTGKAVDIACSGNKAHSIIGFASFKGMTGIGVKQHGEHNSRFIHIDDTEGATRPWLWSYK